jgi:methyl-accepting chemotaxis protein
VDAIAGAIEEQSSTGADIAGHVRSIMEQAQDNPGAAEQTLREAEQLDYLAINLKEIGNVFKLGNAGEAALNLHSKMPGLVQQWLQVGGLFEGPWPARISLETVRQKYSHRRDQAAEVQYPFRCLCDQLCRCAEAPVSEKPEMVYALA